MDQPQKFGYETSDGQVVEATLDEFRRFAVALLLASADVKQASAACDMLDEGHDDPNRARALETAIVVCYARAFTVSTLARLPALFAPPAGSEERQLHDILLTLRHKVYAHTDLESGRSVEKLTVEVEGDIAHVAHRESWQPLDTSRLDSIRALCATQHRRFQLEGTRIAGAIVRAETERAGRPRDEPNARITIRCPRCRHEFGTLYRPSINLDLDTWAADELEELTTARCPRCKLTIVPNQYPTSRNRSARETGNRPHRLGATVCRPRRPRCIECPLRRRSAAFQSGAIEPASP